MAGITRQDWDTQARDVFSEYYDSATVTAVQASVLNILSVAIAVVDYAKDAELHPQVVTTKSVDAPAAAAASLTAGTEAAPFPGDPLLQLVGRLTALAALHILLAVSGLWPHVRHGDVSSGDCGERGRRTEYHGSRVHDSWGRNAPGGVGAERRQRLSMSESDAVTADLDTAASIDEPGQLVMLRPAQVSHEEHDRPAAEPSSVVSPFDKSCRTALGERGGALPVADMATNKSVDIVDNITASQLWQQQKQQHRALHHEFDLQYEHRDQKYDRPRGGGLHGPEVLPRPSTSGWHHDFATEQRHVAATRLADAALLAYTFLEASGRMCGTVAPPRRGSDSCGTVGAVGPRDPGSLSYSDFMDSGGKATTLRQLRCLAALLVTSWGSTALLMNIIIIFWPRSRRPRHVWLINGMCSWVAGASRVGLLMLLAPADPAAATMTAAVAVGSGKLTRQSDIAAAYVTSSWASCGGEADGGHRALTATIVLVSNLISSNLSPVMYGIQSAAAALAGALLHSRLSPGAAVSLLVMLYGNMWMTAALLSFYIAWACRHVPESSSADVQDSSGDMYSGSVVKANGGGGSVCDGRQYQHLPSPLSAVLDAVSSSSGWISRRALQPPRLGLRATGWVREPGIISPGNAASSDLLLRNLPGAVRPHCGVQGQPAGPRTQSVIKTATLGRRSGGLETATEAVYNRSAPCRTSSLDPRRFMRSTTLTLPPQSKSLVTTTSAAVTTSMTTTTTTATTTTMSASTLCAWDDNTYGSPFNESAAPSACMTHRDRVHPPPPLLPASQSSGEGALSYVRRTLSERPPTLSRHVPTVAPPPISHLHQSSSWGPMQGPLVASAAKHYNNPNTAVNAGAIAAAATAVWTAAASGKATGTPSVQHGDSHVPSRQPSSRPLGAPPSLQVPRGPTATATATATPTRMLYSDGGGEAGGPALQSSMAGQLPAASLARTRTSFASSSGAAAATDNDMSVLSSVILEADAYDRMLSSVSSPFLLNPGNTLMANTGFAPPTNLATSPTFVDLRTCQYLPQQHPQHPSPSFRPISSSGLSETSALDGGTHRGGTGASPPGHRAATSDAATSGVLAAAFPVQLDERRAREDSAEGRGGLWSLELGSLAEGSHMDTFASSNGGRGRGTAALGSRSRLDLTASPAATAEAAAGPATRQIIILADGRQVYQSEMLAAAVSGVSPLRSASRLRSASVSLLQPRGQGHTPASLSGRRLAVPATGSSELIMSMPRSHSEALGRGTSPVALTSASPTTTTNFTRHLSYSVRDVAGGCGGGRGLSPSIEPLSSRNSNSRQSPLSESPMMGGSTYGGGEGMKMAPHWLADECSPRSRDPAQSQPPYLQRTMSVGPSGMRHGDATYAVHSQGTTVTERGVRGFGGYGSSLSCRSSFTPRATVGGNGGTSASSRLSSNYGLNSGATTSGGCVFTTGGTSDPSYCTGETCSSGAGGGNRGVSQRPSLDIGRHLHESGLIRIGEEDPDMEADDVDVSASALFDTCTEAFDGLGNHIGNGSSGSGFNRSESDQRSLTAEQASNGTASGDTPMSQRPLTVLSCSSSSIGSGAVGNGVYGSSSIGSGLNCEVASSASLVPRAPDAAASAMRSGPGAHPPPPRPGRRSHPGRGNGIISAASRHRIQQAATGHRADMSARAEGRDAPGAVDPGFVPTVSSIDMGGDKSAGGLGSVGSFVRGMTQEAEGYRELSESPTTQTLLQSEPLVSPNGALPQLSVAAAGVSVFSYSRGSMASASGSGSDGRAGGGTPTSAGVLTFTNCRHLLGGYSQHHLGNPSLLSYVEITLASNLPPGASTAVADATDATTDPVIPSIEQRVNNSHSHRYNRHSSTYLDTGNGATTMMATLAQGITTRSSQGSSRVAGGGESGTAVATAAGEAAAAPPQATAATTTTASSGSSGMDCTEPSCTGLQVTSFPHTRAPMVESGSTRRGSIVALTSTGTAVVSGSVVTTQQPGSSVRLGPFAACSGSYSGGESRTASRPTLPELLESTAVAAVAIGHTSVYASAPEAVAASGLPPWDSPSLMSARLGTLTQPSTTATAAAARPSVAMSLRKLSRHPFNLFSTVEGSCGAVDSGTGRSPAVNITTTTASAGSESGVVAATPGLSQPLDRRRRSSWFGHFLVTKRGSMSGSIGTVGFVGAAANDSAIPLHQAQTDVPRHSYGNAVGAAAGVVSHASLTAGGGGELPDGRTSAASGWSRSSQQLMRLMDDTARLSPVRDVIRGLRKRIRSGVKNLGGGGGGDAGETRTRQ